MSYQEPVFKWQIEERGIRDPLVLRAMRKVPRHEFVSEEHRQQAYDDHPLPIGHGQTISQPYIVAVMSEQLRLDEGSRVLEIGTGSGYQAAILAEIVAQVYSVEIVPELATAATTRLQRLGYRNVEVRTGDGYLGWPEYAPYDAIILTCAPEHVPSLLVEQLGAGGRMVLPLGPAGGRQALWLLERQGRKIRKKRLMGVAFVPLTGRHAPTPSPFD